MIMDVNYTNTKSSLTTLERTQAKLPNPFQPNVKTTFATYDNKMTIQRLIMVMLLPNKLEINSAGFQKHVMAFMLFDILHKTIFND